MYPFKNKINAEYNIIEKAFIQKTIKVLTIALVFMLGNVVVKSQIPCDSSARGLYYLYPYASAYQLPVLHPSMPYDILIGYLYTDSMLKAYNRNVIENTIKSTSYNSDTMSYLMKYMYRMADYSPIMYEQFLGMTANMVPFRRTSGWSVSSDFLNYLHNNNDIYDIEKYLTRLLLEATYIYHIQVVDTIFIDSIDITKSDNPEYVTSLIAYSTIIDKIKGQKTPAEEYILTPLVLNGNKTPNAATTNYLDNHNDYFAFEYFHLWARQANFRTDDGVYNFFKRLLDAEGNPWVIPDREFIVFARVSGGSDCGSKSSNVMGVKIVPVGGNTSGGMLPVIDGNVIDEENNLGFGEVVPVELFKELLRNKIDLIKNYGE